MPIFTLESISDATFGIATIRLREGKRGILLVILLGVQNPDLRLCLFIRWDAREITIFGMEMGLPIIEGKYPRASFLNGTKYHGFQDLNLGAKVCNASWAQGDRRHRRTNLVRHACAHRGGVLGSLARASVHLLDCLSHDLAGLWAVVS